MIWRAQKSPGGLQPDRGSQELKLGNSIMKHLNTNNNVATIRRRYGLGRYSFAVMLGWTNEQLFEYERDVCDPSSPKVAEIIAAFKSLGADIDALDLFIRYPEPEALQPGEKNKIKAIRMKNGISLETFAKAMQWAPEAQEQLESEEIRLGGHFARVTVLAFRRFGVYVNDEMLAGVKES